ncbi:hypothetical protein D3H65_15995 [Paraflavitalea soli]|uniref:histidine kinase n=1 Tax=Paraflavitalea soli TaxID=2315862 RepID=A0A3B7MUT6_9BACT|nr:histidine kinase dimerization/phosphoacceptor domain -containing protein [Paraflavitalea soli]AXY75395.1 hypothetical protein D3H65_15995 [Paraflavitalea soli]
MKILSLFMAMVCFFFTGYGQYIDGDEMVGADEIPGLVKQLDKELPAEQKAAVLIKIGLGYLYKAGEAKADLDSTLYYARAARALGEQLGRVRFVNESLLLMGMVDLERRDMAGAKKMLAVLDDSSQLKLLLYISITYVNEMPVVREDHSLLDSGGHYAEAAVRLALKIKMRQKTALQRLEQVAIQYSTRHERGLAEKYYLLAEQYGKGGSYPSKARTLGNLSRIYSDEGNFYKALSYGINAEKALTKDSDVEDLSLINTTLASLYTTQEKYEQALVYGGRMLAEPDKYRYYVFIYAIANSYCNNLRKLHRTKEILPFLQKFKEACPLQEYYDHIFYHLALGNGYKDMGQYDRAEQHFLASIRYADSAHYTASVVYFNLGSLYQQMNEHTKALAAFKTAEKGLTNEVMQASNLSYIAQSAAALGDYRDAYGYLVKSKGISDSIYVVSKEKVLQELEVEYQTQKKEAALQGAMEQARVRKQVTIIIISLLAVIIGLLIWLFWSKLQSNKVITGKNVQLEQLVKDKSWLLKEMHHRVKNNLHTIMNLLEFQSAYLHDDALAAIKNSQSRIFSMSLIHQQLYQTDEDVKTIDMGVYIPELVSYLKECFGMDGHCVVVMDMDPALVLPVEEAVPLGLIINEGVTNSMKYAFKKGEQGEIHISLKATEASAYELLLADNGKGLDADFDVDTAGSLGFQLIKGLSEQLGAQLEIVNEGGVKIRVSGILVKGNEATRQ